MGCCGVLLLARYSEFVPYTFQLLSQLLELHTDGAEVPAGYRALLPLLLTPPPWAQKGSIPGLVRFIRASLERDSMQIIQAGHVTAILAVAQQRLIPSKLNDGWGFELLQGVVKGIPLQVLSVLFLAS